MKAKFLFLGFLFGFIFSLNAQDDCLSFTLAQDDIGTNTSIFGVSLADFNGDGWLDVVSVQAYDRIEVHFANGNGTFDTTTYIYGEDRWRFGVKAFDIDNDGDMDFVTVPFSRNSDYGLEVWENDGNGNFTLKTDDLVVYTDGQFIDVGDLDNDGDLDIFYPTESDGIYILKNDGNGNFSVWQNIDNNTDYNDVHLFDADNDGDLDAVVFSDTSTPDPAKLFYNDGSGNFTAASSVISDDDLEGIGVGDIDADGDNDLVLMPWSGGVVIILNDGLGNFYPSGDTLNPSSFFNDGALIDLNKDNLPDILTDKYFWLNNPDTPGKFILQAYTLSGSTHDLDFADINNDGFCDIYMGYFGTSSGDRVYLYNKPAEIVQDTMICPGDTILFNDQYIYEEGDYYFALSCDTVLTLSVSFYDSVSTEVIVNNTTLTAVVEGVNYQWFNCDDNQIIEGANSQSFTPEVSGNYGVILSNDNCSFVSDCYYVEVPTNVEKFNLNIYPNPTDEEIFVSVNSISKAQLLDINGNVLKSFELKIGENVINVQDLAQGVYLLKVFDNQNVVVQKIFVK